jgi:heptosyltransferase-3
MRLLFIKLGSYRDALILAPTLDSARAGYRDSRIWAVVPSGVEGVLQGSVAPDRVCGFPVNGGGLGGVRARLRFLSEARRQRFDYAFELGGNNLGRWLCVLSGARRRVANGCERRQCLPGYWRPAFNRISTSDWLMFHAVEKDYFIVNDCFPLGGRAPALIFAPERMRSWDAAPALGTYAVLDPTQPREGDAWPLERWAAVATHLLQLLDRVVVCADPDAPEGGQAAALLRCVGERAVRGPSDWSQLAGVLQAAHLCVAGNTTVLHLAAACRCPSVALFGATPETRWHPWQSPHRIVVEPGASFPYHDAAYLDRVAGRRLAAVRVEDAVEACDEMIAGGREME